MASGSIEIFGDTGSAKLTVPSSAGSATYNLPSTTGIHDLATVEVVAAMIKAAMGGTPTPTPPTVYKISGNVVYYDGTAAANAEIQVRNSSQAILAVGHGTYNFTLSSGQTYFLLVNQPGYSSSPGTVQIINAAAATLIQNFKIGPAAWFCTTNNCANITLL